MEVTKVIGITGLYCAGKNHVARFLEQRSFPVLDVDKLGHKIIEEEKERLITRFGKDILDPNGLVDRKKLGRKVFGKPEDLTALEEIIHPAANRETREWLNARQESVCFVNAALLHRSSAFEALNAVIIVEAGFLVRLFRAKKRDRLSWILLLKRFWSQRKFNYQLFKEKTDIYRVGNSLGCTNSKLEKRIDEILALQGTTRV